MVFKRALVATAGLGVAAVLTLAIGSARVALVERTNRAVAAPVPGNAKLETEKPPVMLEPEARRNLFGDEVNDAVAEYLIDREGNVYELHAPYTEIPRLGAPET